jgi:nucleotide-binding universal stress UspA family protein
MPLRQCRSDRIKWRHIGVPTEGGNSRVMKTILALIGGGDRDEVILKTARAAAVPLSAHLNFLHIHVTPSKAARYSGAEFAIGPALRNALDQLEVKAKTFSEVAERHVRQFCANSGIEICDMPTSGKEVTASFHEENDTTMEKLIHYARRSDLIVLGRAKQTQGLAPDTLEYLVLNCGRPVLVAATAAPRTLTETVMVCWNGSRRAARAVAAAMPVLTHSKRVVFTTVVERDKAGTEVAHDVTRQLAWSGISIETRVISANDSGISMLLSAAAEDCKADLVVMGAYGHSRIRELIFGSWTETFIRDVDKPILLMH